MPTEWQWHYLAEDITEAALNAGTVRLKLPERDQISVIDVELYATKSKAYYDYDIIDVPEKLEVIGDGSAVLYSMSPETAQFAHFCAIRSLPLDVKIDYPALVPHYRCKIPFGRWERDEEYLLDTSFYNNVYLEIPWNLNTIYFSAYTFSYTVRYLRPIKKVAPKGFIRSRDIEYGSHAWGAAGHYYVPLPLKYPWYMLGARLYDLDQDLVTNIPHIKLDIDDGRLVLVDEDTDDIMRDNTERLPSPLIIPWKKLCSSGASNYVRSYLGRIYEAHFEGFKDVAAGVITTLRDLFSAQRVKYGTFGPTATTACPCGVNASLLGEAFNCCVIIKDWWLDWFEPVPHEPFPVGEHSEAELDFEHIAVTIDDLVVFLQEICPNHI